MTAGERIRTARLEAGLTQAELAARCGLRQPNLAAYEQDRRNPSAAMISRIMAGARPRPSVVLQQHRDQVRSTVRRHQASDARVFGSVARGNDTADSDLDLLVRFNDDASLLDQSRLILELEQLLKLHVDVVSDVALGRRRESILREAVPL